MPVVDMRTLLEAGVHFGHQTHRWNPKMAPYIFGDRNGIHIIDLSQTVPYLTRALQAVRDVVSGGGRVLFVGTKRQASPIIAEAAKRCGQYYVNHRWLGGMMTNWQTISQSIKRLKQLDEKLTNEHTGLTKKETLQMTRQRDKLELSLGGIQDMGGLPDIIVVVDTNRDELAIAEARRLGIPVVGVIDTNSKPDGLEYPVPGNDDATRAIRLYCNLVADAVIDGIQADLAAQGVDLGAVEEAAPEDAVVEVAPEAAPEVAAPAEAAVAEEAAAVAEVAEAKKAAPKAAKKAAPKAVKKAAPKTAKKAAPKATKKAAADAPAAE
ncbi:MAG: 30S ribosomal protein S2 [Kordiimonadaceae bacterium]|nr:30S ribosomal protein S2 [Kordiimonadaceae bacterium]